MHSIIFSQKYVFCNVFQNYSAKVSFAVEFYQLHFITNLQNCSLSCISQQIFNNITCSSVNRQLKSVLNSSVGKTEIFYITEKVVMCNSDG